MPSPRYFITDCGEPTRVFNMDGSHHVTLTRYGVWDTVGKKPHVVDQGEDLEELKRKYATSKVIVLKNDKTQV